MSSEVTGSEKKCNGVRNGVSASDTQGEEGREEVGVVSKQPRPPEDVEYPAETIQDEDVVAKGNRVTIYFLRCF